MRSDVSGTSMADVFMTSISHLFLCVMIIYPSKAGGWPRFQYFGTRCTRYTMLKDGDKLPTDTAERLIEVSLTSYRCQLH